jgi:hypothetical protein
VEKINKQIPIQSVFLALFFPLSFELQIPFFKFFQEKRKLDTLNSPFRLDFHLWRENKKEIEFIPISLSFTFRKDLKGKILIESKLKSKNKGAECLRSNWKRVWAIGLNGRS